MHVLDPIEDIFALGFKLLDLLLYKFHIGLQRKAAIDPLNPPISLRELIDSCKQTYLNGKRKILSPYFKYFFQDPLVSILWWLQFFMFALKAAKQLGR